MSQSSLLQRSLLILTGGLESLEYEVDYLSGSPLLRLVIEALVWSVNFGFVVQLSGIYGCCCPDGI